MRTKKSLGQHFLNSPKIIGDIVSAGKVTKGDLVLEIGPGEGTLTSALLKTGASVVTVEKDDRLIPILQEKFEKEILSRQLTLIHNDILNVNISKTVFDIKKSYKIIANIPYYITGQIIRMFLETHRQPESMTLLVQKEVAERVVARDGKESLLSLSVKVYGEPKIIRVVGRGAFTPQPNVDSAVLVIEDISRNVLTRAPLVNFKSYKGRPCKTNEKRFFEIIHAGFAHKRKQLLSNLKKAKLGSRASKLDDAFKNLGINPKSRAEDLPLETWLKLCNILSVC